MVDLILLLFIQEFLTLKNNYKIYNKEHLDIVDSF